MRELISFSRAEVHFSGVGDFDIDEIDFGIYTEIGEEEGWRLLEFIIGREKSRLVFGGLRDDMS